MSETLKAIDAQYSLPALRRQAHLFVQADGGKVFKHLETRLTVLFTEQAVEANTDEERNQAFMKAKLVREVMGEIEALAIQEAYNV